MGVWIIVLILFAGTVWLGWLNRASEKVAVNAPPAALLAIVGVLSALLFSLKSESQKVEFPVEFVVEPSTKRTMSSNFFLEVNEYTDPGWGTPAANFIIIPEIAAVDPTLAAAQDDASLM